ncbi:DUF6122 family protein [Paraflavisolibacter sp. H34]|uniref:DUF6122 family protein n=1 Tax=Huijunlia imazamoxiresistens TaxID=3127457 RepID=UPI00301A3154
MQTVVHYFLHFIFPAFVAYAFYRDRWKQAYGVLLATMLVDLDHLLAVPIFDPCRCSVGFHPLHSYAACTVYVICLFFPRLRLPAIGLCLHMLTDGLDCLWNRAHCG